MERKIDGLPFKNWVERDGERGTISALCDDMILWEVAESNIPELQRKLREAKMIYQMEDD